MRTFKIIIATYENPKIKKESKTTTAEIFVNIEENQIDDFGNNPENYIDNFTEASYIKSIFENGEQLY